MDLEALAALLAASHRSVYFKRRSADNGGGAVRPLSTARQLLGVALAGGLGGLINATLCYVDWPVSVTLASFRWHVIPAGFIRGSTLATLSVGAGILGRHLKWPLRWFVALPIGWIAGYLSWIPLDMSIFHEWLSEAVRPIGDNDSWNDVVAGPIQLFGGVATLLYLGVAHTPTRPLRGKAVIVATTAGVLGSLWFWIGDQWYFSLLHGAVWGCLVGLALSKSGILPDCSSSRQTPERS